ncbi:phytanoyl-CoA dioxygenase family protein [Acidiferrimicrobium sp. IK]|uniref:phytanoyl-CoA dioxygenase family protein n=1 Tax=Acidiferrimicrobium sp. IK TaxID=2871700 RepID=UPI0021CB3F6A|nr:phytanoyl-CoA dioxygenase family protein [Acidiferrimicrobium sp. IK]MCU4185455.1 phytanoyl-CoA dioxygenase family protein [Acidiferrimicrobium sp. IK]
MTTVTSNGVEIPFDADHFAPLRDSTALIADPAALRDRYETDGYVLVRNLLDPQRLRDLRAAYFEQFDPCYLKPGTRAADGIFSGRRPPGLNPHGTAGHPAHDFVRSQPFLDFCAKPELAALATTILGAPVEQLPRRILRHFDNSSPRASRAHVDYAYLDAGSDRLLTAWVPIGDCPLTTGALVYLEGSHLLAPADMDRVRSRTDRADDRRPLSHDLAWVAEQLGRRWLYADFAAGDVIVHSPHTVHASLDTTTESMRLSADLRYIAAGEPQDARWQEAWAGDDGK